MMLTLSRLLRNTRFSSPSLSAQGYGWKLAGCLCIRKITGVPAGPRTADCGANDGRHSLYITRLKQILVILMALIKHDNMD